MNIATEKAVHNWNHFILENDHGMTVGVLDYGGILTHICAPDVRGHSANVVLGYENFEDYKENPNYFGAIIGRVAGRIKDATFQLEDQTFSLEKNEGDNHLHGGTEGFSHVIWEAEPFEKTDTVGVKLTHTSPDGTGGYPGKVVTTVTYTLGNDNTLTVTYEAETDQPTPLALTNHTYFNLRGDLVDTIDTHQVQIPSGTITELDENLLPTGRQMPVAGTPLDFRNGRELKDGLGQETSHAPGTKEAARQLNIAGNGYDHYFLFNEGEQQHRIFVQEPVNGRTMTIETDQPGMVMYTANGLDEGLALNGGMSKKHLGVCFETQAHPGALHHNGFPGIILKPGELYQKQTSFKFGVAPEREG
ncbi:aldose epimerase family protein [Lentibacillus sp. JNUCC-1]|uniref:aldose epimerase family protein n=1 Tax=Lentibacillus sp. JNUCC-1 TaxID=2654513 RepID=UPI0012E8FF8B|nr:aldose epimerase family protein [Lentibacillus sp. JNUCC-1]